jgi:hypothetical protein
LLGLPPFWEASPVLPPFWEASPVLPPFWEASPVLPPFWEASPVLPPFWEASPVLPPFWEASPDAHYLSFSYDKYTKIYINKKYLSSSLFPHFLIFNLDNRSQSSDNLSRGLNANILIITTYPKSNYVQLSQMLNCQICEWNLTSLQGSRFPRLERKIESGKHH